MLSHAFCLALLRNSVFREWSRCRFQIVIATLQVNQRL